MSRTVLPRWSWSRGPATLEMMRFTGGRSRSATLDAASRRRASGYRCVGVSSARRAASAGSMTSRRVRAAAESSWMARKRAMGSASWTGMRTYMLSTRFPEIRSVSSPRMPIGTDATKGWVRRLAAGEEVAPQRSGADREVGVVEAPAERMSHGEQLGKRERRHREGPLAWQRDVEGGARAVERLRGADRCPRAAPGRRGRVASRLRHELREGS